LRVADLSDSGDGYDTYGYIQYVLTNYREAADAFQMAIDKGELSNRADTLLFLSRSLIELEDFEGSLDAAKQSADAGDESEQRSANDYIRFIESTRDRFNIIAERREDAIDFYEPYPSLLD
jgi:tetratricopeptide (TPR) repeat protein